MVIVKNFPSRMYAEMAQQSLQAEGIPSVIKAPDYGSGGSGVGRPPIAWVGVDLYVEEEFVERAKEILEAFYNGM